jgi:uncharacterized membrane protein
MAINPHLLEWLNLLARWVHVIAGIMWVGNSMLFNWLDRNLRSADSTGPSKFGEAWLLHSGGFYRVEKFMLNTAELPPLLHWFKWQSYTTWISGVCLLVLIYFSGQGAYLTDPTVSSLGFGDAVGLTVAVLAGGWMFYDLLWRIPGVASTLKGALTLLGIILATWLLCHQVSGRAAYLLMGALLGTFMAGNVFFHIIPSQKEMVASITAGRGHDMALAERAKQRSIHNNYFTFPVIFAMLSNHYGGLYGHRLNWLILLVVFAASAGLRHFMNIRFTFPAWRLCFTGLFAAATAILVGIFNFPQPGRVAFTPAKPAATISLEADLVPFAQVWEIIRHRCTACHSATPSDPVFAAATGGVHYDTPQQIQHYAPRIKERAVIQQTMPLANKTGITPEERALLGRWIDQGAVVETAISNQ